jgi:hypothetical protein
MRMPMDNFEQIRDLLDFSIPGTFYFLQILKRRKDNPDLGKDMVHIADYYIDSLSKYDELKPVIIRQCEAENARAYFRLNRRDEKRVASEALKLMVEYVLSENYKPAKSVYASCAGKYPSEPNKTWIVDLDWKDIPEGLTKDFYIDSVISSINSITKAYRPDLEQNIVKIQTMNGLHLIVNPFRLDEFQKHWPGIDVHRENPTILYCI